MEDHLPWLLETFHPDLVLYDAGVDPHWEDELGRLRLTDQGDRSSFIDKYLYPHIPLHTLLTIITPVSRFVSKRSVCDEDCGEQRYSCCFCHWWRILQRHRQTGSQTLHRPQSCNTGRDKCGYPNRMNPLKSNTFTCLFILQVWRECGM